MMPLQAMRCGVSVTNEEITAGAFLPLEHLEVHATVIDVACDVSVAQRYWYYVQSGSLRYELTLPARATVNRFELRTEDGAVISIVSEAASGPHHGLGIDVGRGLIEYEAGEQFSVSLEDIVGPQHLTFEISYVLSLIPEDPKGLRFHIPAFMGNSVGSTITPVPAPKHVPSERVNITVDVYTTGAVKSITSPTHTIKVLAYKTSHKSRQYHRTVKLATSEPLNTDFILYISVEGLDAPRCIAQRSSTGAVALQLSLIPKFPNLKPLTEQEYIFLIDRSISMSWEDKMSIAKNTLAMLLRTLPSQGTTFNIFPFCGRCESIWDSSVTYDQDTLAYATEYIRAIEVNGGTLILEALEASLRSRNKKCATACFLLTDGEDTRSLPSTIAGFVAQAVAEADPAFPLRVFTLGIGSMSVRGMQTCQEVANAGNGICAMAANAADIVAEYGRLVQAGRTVVLKNVSIDWNVSSRSVLQSPTEIGPLYTGSDTTVYALVEDETCPMPEQVVVYAQRDGIGEVLNFVIPVDEIRLPSRASTQRIGHGTQLVHTLAARNIIDNYQRNPSTSIPRRTVDVIARLGAQYHLYSPYTPYVAVNETTGQAVAVSSAPRNLLPAIVEEARPDGPAIGLLTTSPSPVHSLVLSSPQLMEAASAVARGPSPASQPRGISTFSGLTENEIYEVPLFPAATAGSHGVGTIPSLSEEAEPRGVLDTVYTEGPAVELETTAGCAAGADTCPTRLTSTSSARLASISRGGPFWRPIEWIKQQQQQRTPLPRRSPPGISDDGHVRQGTLDTTLVSSGAPAASSTTAPRVQPGALSDDPSPTDQACTSSQANKSPSSSATTVRMVYLPSRPVAFFCAEARCPSTNRITNWKLALLGTPKPRPFCKVRQEEIDRQVEAIVREWKEAQAQTIPVQAVPKVAIAGQADSLPDYEEEVVLSETVVEAEGGSGDEDSALVHGGWTTDQLVMLQTFDGSFPPIPDLEQAVGAPGCLGDVAREGVDQRLWSTALAAAFLKKRLGNQSAFAGIVEKAIEFMKGSGLSGDAIQKLLDRARTVLAGAHAARGNDPVSPVSDIIER